MAKHFHLSVGAIRALLEEPSTSAVDALKRAGDVEGIVDMLDVDLNVGLLHNNAADLQSRVDFYGENRIPAAKAKSLLRLMWEALHDVILIILMVAGAGSLIIGLAFEEDKSHAWVEGAAIFSAVLIVTLVSSLNDWQKERQFRKLNAVKEDSKVNVLRDGEVVQISKYDVVVGDIIILGQGDEIIADGLVFESSGLKINEASLTGESDDIKKGRNSNPFAFSGTQVMDGVGRMVVLAVGLNSQTGIITALIQGKRAQKRDKTSQKDTNRISDASSNTVTVVGADSSTVPLEMKKVDSKTDIATTPTATGNPDEKPDSGCDSDSDSDDEGDEDEMTVLQKKLEKLAIFIGYLGLSVAVLTLLVLIASFCIVTYTERGFMKEDLKTILDYFIVSITIVVVAIPEGLPLAVTLSLAFGMKEMLKENNLVRHLDACETMGSATAVCSDKTGTLTTNRMSVMRAHVAAADVDAQAPVTTTGVSEAVAKCLVEGVAVNSTAEVKRPESGVGLYEHIGSKTECALLQYIMEGGFVYQPHRAALKPVVMFPFSSATKSSGVVVASTLIDGSSGHRLHVKGASEIILERCTRIVAMDGTVRPLDDVTRARINALIEDYAQESLRTLSLAYKEFSLTDPTAPSEEDWNSIPAEDVQKDLTLIALFGIEDPLRPEVPGAIQVCKEAGITVRMVTGDNVTTARAIAKKCGILTSDDDLVLEGPEFRRMVLDSNGKIRQDEMDKIWPRLRVLARSSPTDKYTLVSGMVNNKIDPQVVAVTGDGTNDAPALKRADVGFAMGIQGTAVAKNASDIILMDDNFNSIVAAVKWGRNVYDSVAKFVQFQLTVNIVALVLAFVSACIIRQSPLTATQLLWINLVMDTLASLALATEKPTDNILQRKPYGRNKSLISRRMWLFMLGHAAFQMTLMFALTFYGHVFFDIPNGKGQRQSQHYTIVFNTFALCQFFNEINARKLHGEINVFKGILSNKYLGGVMITQFTVQVILVQFGGLAVNVASLSVSQWAWCFLFASLGLPYNFILSCLPKIIPKSWKVRMAAPTSKRWWIRQTGGVRRALGFKVKDRQNEGNDGETVVQVSNAGKNK